MQALSLPMSCGLVLQHMRAWSTPRYSHLPSHTAWTQLHLCKHPAFPPWPGQASELLSQATAYSTANCYWVKKKKKKEKSHIYMHHIYTCIYVYRAQVRINRVCSSKTEVWISTEFILQSSFEISLLHSLSVEVPGLYAQKIKTGRKGLAKQSYCLEWVNANVSTDFSRVSAFVMSAKVTICWQTKQRRKSSFLLCLSIFTPTYLSWSVWHCLQPAAVMTKKVGP